MESFYTNAMDITVTKQESIFNGLVLKEKVDEEVLHKLIHSDLLKEVLNSFNGKSYANEKEQLMSYRRLIKDGYAHVLYSKTSICHYDETSDIRWPRIAWLTSILITVIQY
jgi:hypothetical protein